METFIEEIISGKIMEKFPLLDIDGQVEVLFKLTELAVLYGMETKKLYLREYLTDWDINKLVKEYHMHDTHNMGLPIMGKHIGTSTMGHSLLWGSIFDITISSHEKFKNTISNDIIYGDFNIIDYNGNRYLSFSYVYIAHICVEKKVDLVLSEVERYIFAKTYDVLLRNNKII
jgi:hypothetical protein